MSISELIAAIGDDKVQFQFLSRAMTNISVGKQCSKVTFETAALHPSQVVTDSGPVGMILWLPRDEFERVTSKIGASPTTEATK